MCRQAAAQPDTAENVYSLFTAPDDKYPIQQSWNNVELGAEMPLLEKHTRGDADLGEELAMYQKTIER